MENTATSPANENIIITAIDALMDVIYDGRSDELDEKEQEAAELGQSERNWGTALQVVG